jgi:hypothetical protein
MTCPNKASSCLQKGHQLREKTTTGADAIACSHTSAGVGSAAAALAKLRQQPSGSAGSAARRAAAGRSSARPALGNPLRRIASIFSGRTQRRQAGSATVFILSVLKKPFAASSEMRCLVRKKHRSSSI